LELKFIAQPFIYTNSQSYTISITLTLIESYAIYNTK